MAQSIGFKLSVPNHYSMLYSQKGFAASASQSAPAFWTDVKERPEVTTEGNSRAAARLNKSRNTRYINSIHNTALYYGRKGEGSSLGSFRGWVDSPWGGGGGGLKSTGNPLQLVRNLISVDVKVWIWMYVCERSDGSSHTASNCIVLHSLLTITVTAGLTTIKCTVLFFVSLSLTSIHFLPLSLQPSLLAVIL